MACGGCRKSKRDFKNNLRAINRYNNQDKEAVLKKEEERLKNDKIERIKARKARIEARQRRIKARQARIRLRNARAEQAKNDLDN